MTRARFNANNTSDTYYLYDGLGSVRGLTDGNGNQGATYDYDAYGALRSTPPAHSNVFRFTGEQQDSAANRGLIYLRARHYDPALGRFLQEDPVPLANRYAYVEGNPVTRVDPTGKQSDDPIPVPLPIPGSDDVRECLKGFETCIDEVAPREHTRRNAERPGRKPLLQEFFDNVCDDFLQICLHHTPGEGFDFAGAIQKMRSIDWSTRRVFRLPFTGTGGLLANRSNTKEGTFSCWPRPWSRFALSP